ncbi:type II toxin-antitoxin system Phd/YefM family antitoxin [Chlorobaculum thiosulfatiphilum]|uniref:type II toxin-antitoxin system Phd/YefM family antitoxin n=1 Tax=Chlorobaculum thiosulfatiphilum TaxID=115852 RepID=UPI001B870218
MKEIRVSSDIIPLGEFKTGLSTCLKRVQTTGHPLIITQNGRPAGVLLSPEEYDKLVYRTVYGIRRTRANGGGGRRSVRY